MYSIVVLAMSTLALTIIIRILLDRAMISVCGRSGRGGGHVVIPNFERARLDELKDRQLDR